MNFFFTVLFKLLGFVDGFFRVFLEPSGQHLLVDVVLPQLLGLPFASLLSFDVEGDGVGGDDGALVGEVGR